MHRFPWVLNELTSNFDAILLSSDSRLRLASDGFLRVGSGGGGVRYMKDFTKHSDLGAQVPVFRLMVLVFYIVFVHS